MQLVPMIVFIFVSCDNSFRHLEPIDHTVPKPTDAFGNGMDQPGKLCTGWRFDPLKTHG